MKANTQPRVTADASVVRELREHANLINLMTDGRLTGTNNATTAAPTTGSHASGDFVKNSAPSVGLYRGWEYDGSVWYGVGQIGAMKDTTANRPTKATLGLASDDGWVGYLYLDTTLDADGKPIWWTGAAWVDATGATV